MLFLDTLNAELFGCYTVSWHPIALCVCVCINGPEASIGSGSLPHRCLLNGQIHTQLTWLGSREHSWSLLYSPPHLPASPPVFFLCAPPVLSSSVPFKVLFFHSSFFLFFWESFLSAFCFHFGASQAHKKSWQLPGW